METPGARKLTLFACRFGLDSANGVSRDQATASENKRNNTDSGGEQGEILCTGQTSAYFTAAFRLPRFQYKYPGAPISTIAVPQNASVGRVMIVFSVHDAPTST
jgi:hypothetical protein